MDRVDEKKRLQEIKELEALFGNYEMEDTAHILDHPDQYLIALLRAFYGEYGIPDTERILKRLERLSGPPRARDFVDSMRYHGLDWGWNGFHEDLANEQDVKDNEWIRYDAKILDFDVEYDVPEDWDDMEDE